MQLIFPKSVLITIYNALILPHINYCLLSCVTLFKLYNVLKVEDIYNYRLFVLYYNLKHNTVPNYITSFLPNTSIARERYPIRQPRYQPPLHAHEYISKTCKYRLPVFLNSINNNSHDFDKLSNIIHEINDITLAKFKNVIKGCMINKYSYYCNILNCYICQL